MISNRNEKRSSKTSPLPRTTHFIKQTHRNSTSKKQRPPLASNKRIHHSIILKKYHWRKINTNRARLIDKLIQNKSKVATELRLTAFEKEYLSKFYSLPMQLLSQFIPHHDQTTLKPILHLTAEYRIWKIIKDHQRGHICVINNKCKAEQCKKTKKLTPILSTMDDSANQLKTLVGHIENMIKTQEQFRILDQMSLEASRFNGQMGEFSPNFDNANVKLSVIDAKPQAQNENKSEQARINTLQQYLITEPLVNFKHLHDSGGIDDEYGILRKPPKEVFFRRKKKKIQEGLEKSERKKSISVKSLESSQTRSQQMSQPKLSKSTRKHKKPKQLDQIPPNRTHKKSPRKNEVESSYYQSSNKITTETSPKKRLVARKARRVFN